MVAQALASLMPDGGRRQLTSDEREVIEDVLDAASEWQAGRLPWEAAAQVGTLLRGSRPSAGYSRFVAAHVTPRSDPRRAALEALQDHLDRMRGLIVGERGTISRTELNDITEARHLMERMAA